jgi:hypothetical protein
MPRQTYPIPSLHGSGSARWRRTGKSTGWWIYRRNLVCTSLNGMESPGSSSHQLFGPISPLPLSATKLPLSLTSSKVRQFISCRPQVLYYHVCSFIHYGWVFWVKRHTLPKRLDMMSVITLWLYIIHSSGKSFQDRS